MFYLFPLILTIICTLFYIQMAVARRGKAQFLDIGLMFVIIVSIYGIFPSVGFILASFGIGEIADGRQPGYPNIYLIEYIESLFVVFLLGFILTYIAIRRYSTVRQDHSSIGASYFGPVVFSAIALLVAIPLAKIFLGVRFSSDYAGTYTELRTLPLLFQQLFNVAEQVSFALVLCAIVCATAARPERHRQYLVGIVLYIVYAILSGGSRSQAFLSFFAYLVAVSIYVPGFNFRRLIPIGLAGLALFMIAGFVRGYTEGDSYLALLQSGEFMSLFVTGIDLKQRVDAGFVGDFGLQFYLVDFLRFVPSQVVGADKIDPATWYVQTFYPDFYDSGGGLAFGAMAESVVGFGRSEAAMRGAVLGAIFAFAANRLVDRRVGLISVFVYVWLAVVSYQSFRDTTLSFVSRGVFQVFPVILILLLVGRERKSQGTSSASA